MDIQIREGKAEDAYAISELNKNELGYEFEAEKTKEKLSHILNGNRSKLFVAVVQNAVLVTFTPPTTMLCTHPI